jgi:hypothetical protein
VEAEHYDSAASQRVDVVLHYSISFAPWPSTGRVTYPNSIRILRSPAFEIGLEDDALAVGAPAYPSPLDDDDGVGSASAMMYMVNIRVRV